MIEMVAKYLVMLIEINEIGQVTLHMYILCNYRVFESLPRYYWLKLVETRESLPELKHSWTVMTRMKNNTRSGKQIQNDFFIFKQHLSYTYGWFELGS